MKTLQGLGYFIFLVIWSELVSEINPILADSRGKRFPPRLHFCTCGYSEL